MTDVRRWAIWFAATTIAVAVSYAWLDRPIALFAHAQLQHYDIFRRLTHIPEFTTPLVLVGFVAVGAWALGGHGLSRLQTVLMLSAACLAVAEAVKDQLKFAFGRTWPETWVRNNPSFIHDGVFGFFPFHGGPGYQSFPSGHTAAICAVLSVFWICYPRYRVLYVLGMAAVAGGLVGANFHFLSDVIAGAFLGCSAGWLCVSLWERGSRRVRPDAIGVPAAAAKPAAEPSAAAADMAREATL